MWTLFTAALARGHSSTQVSIMNTSTNFMVTALCGLALFHESLPPLWWLGAALLVAGNVVMGRKDESEPAADADGTNDTTADHGAAGSDAVHAAQEDGVFAPTAQQPGLVPREEVDNLLHGVHERPHGAGDEAEEVGDDDDDDDDEGKDSDGEAPGDDSQVVVLGGESAQSAENGR